MHLQNFTRNTPELLRSVSYETESNDAMEETASRSNPTMNSANRELEIVARTSPATQRLNHWLERLLVENGSDLLLVADASPAIRVEGQVREIANDKLSGTEIEDAVRPALASHALENYEQSHIADSSYRIPGVGRFRINLH